MSIRDENIRGVDWKECEVKVSEVKQSEKGRIYGASRCGWYLCAWVGHTSNVRCEACCRLLLCVNVYIEPVGCPGQPRTLSAAPRPLEETACLSALQRSFLLSSPPPRWTTLSIDYIFILPHAPPCSCAAISAVVVRDVEGVLESDPADQHRALRMLALASLPSDEEAAKSRQRHAAEVPQLQRSSWSPHRERRRPPWMRRQQQHRKPPLSRPKIRSERRICFYLIVLV